MSWRMWSIYLRVWPQGEVCFAVQKYSSSRFHFPPFSIMSRSTFRPSVNSQGGQNITHHVIGWGGVSWACKCSYDCTFPLVYFSVLSAVLTRLTNYTHRMQTLHWWLNSQLIYKICIHWLLLHRTKAAFSLTWYIQSLHTHCLLSTPQHTEGGSIQLWKCDW